MAVTGSLDESVNDCQRSTSRSSLRSTKSFAPRRQPRRPRAALAAPDRRERRGHAEADRTQRTTTDHASPAPQVRGDDAPLHGRQQKKELEEARVNPDLRV